MAFEACGTWVMNHSSWCNHSNRTTEPTVRQEASPGVLSDFSNADVIVNFYVIGLLCVVGVAGNALSVVVLQRDKERRETLFLLQGLAVADAGYLVVSLLRYPFRFVVGEKETYDRMQPVVFPLLKTFQTVTIWMLVLVTVDRFTSVCRPLHRGRRFVFTGPRRRWLAASTFAAGTAYNAPRFVDSCVMKWIDLCSMTVSTRMVYTPTFHSTLYFDVYLYAAYIYLLYVGPLAVLAFVNLRLVRAIRTSRRRRRDSHVTGGGAARLPSLGGGGADLCGDSGATLVLIVIVIVFIVCETPELVLKIVTVVERHFRYDLLSSGLWWRLNAFSELLMVVNSSVNFFVYLAFGRRFRLILVDTLRMTVFRLSSAFLFRSSSSSSTSTDRETLPLRLLHYNCIHAPPHQLRRSSRRHQAQML